MYWTKECIGLRSCTDVALKGLVPDLRIRGCVTCRIISGVKIVKHPLKYMPRPKGRFVGCYIYKCVWVYAYMLQG